MSQEEWIWTRYTECWSTGVKRLVIVLDPNQEKKKYLWIGPGKGKKEATVQCPCGTVNKVSAKVCRVCDVELEEIVEPNAPNVEPEATNMEIDSPVSRNRRIDDNDDYADRLICACGTINDPGIDVCVGCIPKPRMLTYRAEFRYCTSDQMKTILAANPKTNMKAEVDVPVEVMVRNKSEWVRACDLAAFFKLPKSSRYQVVDKFKGPQQSDERGVKYVTLAEAMMRVKFDAMDVS